MAYKLLAIIFFCNPHIFARLGATFVRKASNNTRWRSLIRLRFFLLSFLLNIFLSYRRTSRAWAPFTFDHDYQRGLHLRVQLLKSWALRWGWIMTPKRELKCPWHHPWMMPFTYVFYFYNHTCAIASQHYCVTFLSHQHNFKKSLFVSKQKNLCTEIGAQNFVCAIVWKHF